MIKSANKVIIWLMGGLGNQMFVYAYYRYLLVKGLNAYLANLFSILGRTNNDHEIYKLNYFNLNNLRFASPPCSDWLPYAEFCSVWSLLGNKDFKKRYLFKVLRWKIQHKLFPRLIIDKSTKHYVENQYNRSFYSAGITKDFDISMHGIFQSYKYTAEIRTILLKDFAFPEKGLPARIKQLLSKIQCANSVAVHVRRNDYVALGTTCGLPYYRRAAAYLHERFKNLKFFVFSDDPAWVRDNFRFLSNCFIIDTSNTKKSDYYDLLLMTKAKHNIIANSSFSWWAAWLNQNPWKIVCVPDRWLPPFLTTDEICPPEWVRIITNAIIQPCPSSKI
jgi:hypothetical protein